MTLSRRLRALEEKTVKASSEPVQEYIPATPEAIQILVDCGFLRVVTEPHQDAQDGPSSV